MRPGEEYGIGQGRGEDMTLLTIIANVGRFMNCRMFSVYGMVMVRYCQLLLELVERDVAPILSCLLLNMYRLLTVLLCLYKLE